MSGGKSFDDLVAATVRKAGQPLRVGVLLDRIDDPEIRRRFLEVIDSDDKTWSARRIAEMLMAYFDGTERCSERAVITYRTHPDRERP